MSRRAAPRRAASLLVARRRYWHAEMKPFLCGIGVLTAREGPYELLSRTGRNAVGTARASYCFSADERRRSEAVNSR